MASLDSLLAGLPCQVYGTSSPDIRDIVFDSRHVTPGSLFVALRGTRQDGRSFAPAALQAGAAAVLAESDPPAGFSAPWVRVPDALEALALLSARLWQFPSQSLLMVGITGTNGKTTTSYLVESILSAAGFRTGVLGTIEYRFGDQRRPAPNTTPFASDLQRFLAQVRDNGGRACAMEVSSHALALKRVEGVLFDVGVFTNLTQDHLDFHRTMDAYADAKARLFESLDPANSKPWPKCAIVNSDDPAWQRMARNVRVPVFRYGLSGDAEVQARQITSDASGSRFTVDFRGSSFSARVPLPGDYNVSNALAAISTGLALGLSTEAIQFGLERTTPVPGRMERLTSRRGYSVIVDYAHTEDALRKVMSALRRLKPERLITVFGCGGDRDRTKRPLMGQAAAELSDEVIVTSDNPRSEDPEKIALDVEVGLRRVRVDGYEIELDRERAIARALTKARAGDIVLLAGKGHERYQIIGSTTIPFDDREVARRYLD